MFVQLVTFALKEALLEMMLHNNVQLELIQPQLD